MSNLDQFTINYKIQVNAAISELGKLNNATAKTNKGLNDSAKGASAFADSITKGMGGALPILGQFLSGLKSITAEFGVMAAGATLVTGALTNAMRVRAQFNEQRTQSRDAGMAAVRLEDLQRRAASGNVSRDQVARAVTGSQSFLRGAYADPTRIGPANRLLGAMGINPAAGGAPITNTDFLTRLGGRWHGMNDSQVQAEAQMIGMDKDVALKFKELGASIGQIGMSLKEMQQYLDVAKNVKTLNDELARFNEQITELGQKFAGPVLSSVTTLLKMINDAHLPTTDAGAAAAMNHQLGAGEDAGSSIAEALINDKAQREAAARKETQTANETARWQRAAQKEQERLAAEEQSKKQDLAKVEEQGNADFQSGVSQMELAINAFGAAVGQFGHTIDANQMRAAWAGVTGLAGGISTSGHKALGYSETPGSVDFDPAQANAQYKGVANSSAYDAIIRDKAAKYGVSESTLRGIVATESTFNPNAHSDSSYGLAGINKVNWKAYGLNDKNWNDPEKNIDAGAAILAAMTKKAGGDQRLALRYYHGGFDRTKWGAVNAAYPDKVLGGGTVLSGPQAVAMDPNYKGPWRFTGPTNVAAGLGESLESTQLIDFQKQIAARANVSLSQLQHGEGKHGDVNFGLQNYMSELKNRHDALKQGLGVSALTDMQRANLMGNLKSVDLEALNASRYAPQVLAQTTPGGRENTIGQTPIVVNITGNVKDFLQDVRVELQSQYGKASNSVATGRKQ
ncbi:MULTISPECIES: transglycosylase SLT domain-containing protein [unclassified Caballeronia]|uniref:transglycosylase SLT domain-containing protein n=1 Tax=unclassified Caballeronia TaxID=2646786 RepID=UPI0028639115|nr:MULTISPECIES: transglycosylase SLT domain-containing protein [unclassified Caballeronia]MDR5751129.1 transglycosylase SLT domain-containing protein [Caballeronia sp. LZ024]MDR5844734.1 transglycosylase SLT domain-containing protein [Caballeronia sp. LZ031]